MIEADYARGSRAAWAAMLRECLRHLDVDDVDIEGARWVVEREDSIAALRSVCEDFGDNDWDEGLYLADVIEKHLVRHLAEDEDQEDDHFSRGT